MLKFALCLLFMVTSYKTFAQKIVSVGISSNFSELSTVSFNPFGGYFRDGVVLALNEKKEILSKNGLEIKLTEFDYGSSDLKVLTETKKAIESDVSVVLGYSYSSNALVAAPMHTRAKLPMISPSASANRLGSFGKYVHLGSINNDFMAESLAQIALKSLKLKKAIIIPAVNCAYCVDLSNSFESEFTKLGGQIIKKISVLQDDQDFAKVIEELKRVDFDVVFVPNQELSAARIIAALVNAGHSKPFLGADGWGNEGKEFFSILKGKKFVGYSVTHWHPNLKTNESKKFVAEYLKTFKRMPNDTSVLAYDSMNLLIQAILSTNQHDREGMEKALSGIRSFKGVTGEFIITPNKAPEKDILLLKTSDTGFEVEKIFKASEGITL